MKPDISPEMRRTIIHMISNDLWDVPQTAIALGLAQDTVRQTLYKSGYVHMNGKWITKAEAMNIVHR